MAQFKYKAKRKNAETVLGEISARDKNEAIEILSQKGLLPVTLDEKTAQSQNQRSYRRKKVALKDLVSFNRQLICLLNAGVSLLRALDIISHQIRNPYFKDVINSVSLGIQEGRTFSNCLSDYPEIFPYLYIAMIRSGEESGNLKEVLTNVLEYQAKQYDINSRIKMALAYPTFIVLFGVATIIFLLSFVMPKIIHLVSQTDTQLPMATVILIYASKLFEKFWLLLLMGIAGLVVLFQNWQKTPQGRMVLSQISLQIPALRTFIIKVELARFCRTFSLLLQSGIPILKAFEITEPVISNEIIRAQISKCQEELASGNSLGKSLTQNQLIPSLVSDLILVGEESGALGSTLQDIAQNYEEETNEIAKVVTTFIEPVLIIAIGSLIGFMVIAILLPIFQLNTMQ